mmetsp:Transcript_6262/g.14757  ORF Transcript_6262/g.14757 Transcript_6262/m.14757 type:complete len:103 (+) Transcript_6262:357-665(+)
MDDGESSDEEDNRPTRRLSQVLEESAKKGIRSFRKSMAKKTGMKGFFSKKYRMAGAVAASMQGKPQFCATIIQQVLLRPQRTILLGIARPSPISRTNARHHV